MTSTLAHDSHMTLAMPQGTSQRETRHYRQGLHADRCFLEYWSIQIKALSIIKIQLLNDQFPFLENILKLQCEQLKLHV